MCLTLTQAQSSEIIKHFKFSGGNIEQLVESFDTAAKTSNLDIEVGRYYNDAALKSIKIEVKNIPLKELINQINAMVGYKIADFDQDRIIIYGKIEHYYPVAIRGYNVPASIFKSSNVDKMELQKFLLKQGILFDQRDGAEVVSLTTEKPYEAMIRNNTDELNLIGSVFQLQERISKKNSTTTSPIK